MIIKLKYTPANRAMLDNIAEIIGGRVREENIKNKGVVTGRAVM